MDRKVQKRIKEMNVAVIENLSPKLNISREGMQRIVKNVFGQKL